MIRQATLNDMDTIEATYNEHFSHELEYGAFTVFKKGVYPTRKDAENAINAGALYVYEENGSIAGSMIADRVQPPEYAGIAWGQALGRDEAMVLHLLIVRPSMAGKGVASSLIKYAAALAERCSCKALRLDTGSQNIPAVSLYRKLGFQTAAVSSMKIGGVIEHSEHLFLEKPL